MASRKKTTDEQAQQEEQAQDQAAPTGDAVTLEEPQGTPQPEPFKAGKGEVTPGSRVIVGEGDEQRIGTAIADQDGTWSIRLDGSQEVVSSDKVQVLGS